MKGHHYNQPEKKRVNNFFTSLIVWGNNIFWKPNLCLQLSWLDEADLKHTVCLMQHFQTRELFVAPLKTEFSQELKATVLLLQHFCLIVAHTHTQRVKVRYLWDLDLTPNNTWLFEDWWHTFPFLSMELFTIEQGPGLGSTAIDLCNKSTRVSDSHFFLKKASFHCSTLK